MKTLYDLNKHDTAIIKKLHAIEGLKERFISLGFSKGSEVKVLECTPAKQTIEVQVGSMRFALRESEAKEIEINE